MRKPSNFNVQQRLLDSIWNNEPSFLAKSLAERDTDVLKGDVNSFDIRGFDIRGIIIYRRNLLANAQRSLSITFPTIFELLDSDVSEDLIHQFLKLCPPSQGDWTQWGEGFANFIATTQISDSYPYLSDCAALDWSIHCALHGKDQILNQASLQLLSNSEPEKIAVELNENVTLIKTKYPITEIYQAHHHSDTSQREAAVKEAQIALLKPLEEHVVMVFRPEFQPKVIRLTRSESEFMFHLNSGKSLGTSLDAVMHYNDFTFEKWLVTAIEHNLIYGFRALTIYKKQLFISNSYV